MKSTILADRAQGMEKTILRQIVDLADASCINLGLGELSFPPPKAVTEELSREIGRWPLGYTSNAGLPELRALIAARSGMEIDADRVCVTAGSEEAIFLTLAVLVNPGDEVLIPDPGFSSYPKIVRLWGGVPISYGFDRANRFALQTERIEAVLTSKTKAVILNSPNNPSGTVYARDELQRLAAVLNDRGITAISDEVYKEIFFGETSPASISRWAPTAVVVDSLSKSYAMTGWRLGWCIVPPQLVKPIIGVHQLAVTCASTVSQRAALIALGGGAEDEKRRNVEELRRRRGLALGCLRNTLGLPLIEPAGSFYILVDVSSWRARWGTSLDIAFKLASEHKVITIPGIAFGPGGEGYLRLSFAGTPEDFAEGVRRISCLLA